MAISDNPQVLRRGIRDLVALTTLPAIWAGSQPHEIAESLSDVLLTTLRLDFVYICLARAVPLELVRTSQQLIVGHQAQEIGKSLAPWLKADSSNSVVSIADPLSNGFLQIAVMPIGHEGKDGFAVAGTRSSNALTELDSLLLRVAANQAVAALQQSHLLMDLRTANLLKDSLLAKEQAARAEAQSIAERITLLQELTSSLSQSLTVKQIASAILQTSTRLFNSHGGAVYGMADDGRSVRLLDHVQPGEDHGQFGRIPLALSTPITDAIRTQEMVWIESSEAFLNRYPHLQQSDPQAVAVMPLFTEDRVLGCLELSFISPRKMKDEEITLLSAVAQQCVQALERVRLVEQAQIAVAMEERQRLARDLHDAISQVLFAATTIADALPQLWERNPQRALEQLEQVILLNHAAMGELRTLLLELRPEAIVNSTFTRLLTHLVAAAKGHRKIDAQFEIEGVEAPLLPEVHMALYRIAQESINNILKHSGATHFRIYLQYQPHQITLQINDNGQGFDVQRSSSGLGLGSMRERAEAINAALHIRSIIGQGTEVNVSWQRPED